MTRLRNSVNTHCFNVLLSFDVERQDNIAYVAEGTFPGISDAPTARERGLSAPQCWGFPSIYAYTPFDAEIPNLMW